MSYVGVFPQSFKTKKNAKSRFLIYGYGKFHVSNQESIFETSGQCCNPSALGNKLGRMIIIVDGYFHL